MAQSPRTPYQLGDLVGQRTIIGGPESRYAGVSAPKLATYYLCRCVCGREAWVMRYTLECGKGLSCRKCRFRVVEKKDEKKD